MNAPLPRDRIADAYGRQVSYLRLSITDRCNLQCAYCWHKDTASFIPHGEILSYEELAAIVGLSREVGVSKVRLTGGEPLVRRDFLDFAARLMAAHPGLDLRITTNATLLAGKVRTLKQMGVSTINISLDTLDADRYREITGRDFYGRVRAAMDECLAEGMRLKVNAVAMRGVNSDELPAFLALARDYPLDMRFIEMMPMGADTCWEESRYWPATEILESALGLADLEPVERVQGDGPAKVFTIRGGRGRFGLITPLSDHFCGSCNRLRVTSDGRLRTCLFSDREFRLKPLLRHPRLGIEAVRRVIGLAGAKKPLGFEILEARRRTAVALRRMTAIGG